VLATHTIGNTILVLMVHLWDYFIVFMDQSVTTSEVGFLGKNRGHILTKFAKKQFLRNLKGSSLSINFRVVTKVIFMEVKRVSTNL